MNGWIQIDEKHFVKKDAINSVVLGENGDLLVNGITVSGYYATIARYELGLNRLEQENSAKIECLKAVEAFVAWWGDNSPNEEQVAEQLSLIPPCPNNFMVEPVILRGFEVSGENSTLFWRRDKWVVAKKAPHFGE